MTNSIKLPVITETQLRILRLFKGDTSMGWEYCFDYRWLEEETGLDRKTLKVAVTGLRRLGILEYHRGLLDDDGQAVGSGFDIAYSKHDIVRELIKDKQLTTRERLIEMAHAGVLTPLLPDFEKLLDEHIAQELAKKDLERAEAVKSERERIVEKFKTLCHLTDDGDCKYWKAEPFGFEETEKSREYMLQDKFFPQAVLDKLLEALKGSE